MEADAVYVKKVTEGKPAPVLLPDSLKSSDFYMPFILPACPVFPHVMFSDPAILHIRFNLCHNCKSIQYIPKASKRSCGT